MRCDADHRHMPKLSSACAILRSFTVIVSVGRAETRRVSAFDTRRRVASGGLSCGLRPKLAAFLPNNKSQASGARQTRASGVSGHSPIPSHSTPPPRHAGRRKSRNDENRERSGTMGCGASTPMEEKTSPLDVDRTPSARLRVERSLSASVRGETAVSLEGYGCAAHGGRLTGRPLPIGLRTPRGAPDTVPEPDAEGEAVEARFIKRRLRG